MIEVSIVIVCMNNLKNLYPCLNSIRKYTSVSYETLVVAYLFSKENLIKVRQDFPWVTFIESNEIRGFSENNNLALRQAKGKYCFVVNDDTEMKMSTIDRLVAAFDKCPSNTAIVSPCILNFRNEISFCGKAPLNLWHYILLIFHLWDESKDKVYSNKAGLFKTYDITGAAFLIKTDIFKDMGWFDEYYFFCPEDRDLSTKLNKCGYSCYVDADTKIYHYEGMSGKSLSIVQTATKPAAMLGSIAFHSKGKYSIQLLLRTAYFLSLILKLFYHGLKGLLHPKPNKNQILAIGDINCLQSCFSSKTPKEVFIKYFSKIKKQS